LDRQLNRHINVNEDSSEQEQSDYPKQWAKVAQVLRVAVDPFWSQKNLQISQQMSDNENDQDDAREGHDHFFSNGRLIESSNNIHDGLRAASGQQRAL
jgi:hypothetical protein